MLKAKKKICDGCLEDQTIWKNDGGKRYCKRCWSAHSKTLKPKPTGKQKPIPPRSSKRSKEERIYQGKRIIFLNEHPMCEAHLPGICSNTATEVHHAAGRVGDLLLNTDYWKALCRGCHQWVELHPVKAKEMGLSKSRLEKT